MSFGANLKRELRGITLEEIAQETKISFQILSYIEANQFDRLPEGIFRESFIRSYSRYLGINEEKTVHEFLFRTKQDPSSEIPSDQKNLLKTFSVSSLRKGHPPIKYWGNLLLECLYYQWLYFFFSSLRTGMIQTTLGPGTPYILLLVKIKIVLKKLTTI